jgi:ABC-type enterobactin transport system permease subunit
MATQKVGLDNLGDKMFEAAKASFGSSFASVRLYLMAESEKLAITLRMIVKGCEVGEIGKAEAKILLNQQKVASAAVLTAAEGMTAVAVQAALNAAFKVVKDFVNGRIGFPLL